MPLLKSITLRALDHYPHNRSRVFRAYDERSVTDFCQPLQWIFPAYIWRSRSLGAGNCSGAPTPI